MNIAIPGSKYPSQLDHAEHGPNHFRHHRVHHLGHHEAGDRIGGDDDRNDQEEPASSRQVVEIGLHNHLWLEIRMAAWKSSAANAVHPKLPGLFQDFPMSRAQRAPMNPERALPTVSQRSESKIQTAIRRKVETRISGA